MHTPDPDPLETLEWLDSLDSVWEREGTERAHQLLETVIERARRRGDLQSWPLQTPYLNTLPSSADREFPGDEEVEQRLQALIRWNAMALIVRGARNPGGLGGHIASYASIASLYEIGFNHFFRAPTAEHRGDLVYFQGHSSEGIYARAFLEGRISESQMQHFRQESQGGGLSSYPHPWLMPDFWQFATVSMGLGPLQAIYHWNLLHPAETKRLPYATRCLNSHSGPVIAATDYIRLYADQIRAFVPAPYYVLGTDGFGRSDTRARLRQFFEMDRHWVAIAALHGLADMGKISPQKVAQAMQKYDVDPDKPNPART